jgi:hypothetical protein
MDTVIGRSEPPSESSAPRTRNPFITGNWVRAENFFGRSEILAEILGGQRDALWIIGARRLGKTSLLKELEYRTQVNAQSPFVPLYWDLEGSADARGLAEGLLSSVEDSEPFRRAVDATVEELEGLSVADMLATLVRKTVRSGWRLLLLLDEGEEFLTVARNEVAALLRMRRILHKGPEIRTVLTSTRRLARLEEVVEYATSPFLQGFAPPLYLTPLTREESRALLACGEFSQHDCDTIIEYTSGHPFLLQLIASRLFETGNLEAVLEQVMFDEMVANFFSLDFQTLEKVERRILADVARAGSLDLAALAAELSVNRDALASSVFALGTMGYLAAEGDRYRIGNAFFSRWLRRTRTPLGNEVGP